MLLKEWGEFGLIDRVRSLFDDLAAGAPAGTEGIGDDCAVIPAGDDTAWVVTTDMLVEGVHFLREAIPARDLGRKSLAVNLSDVAAMGAEPVGSFLSVALPPATTTEWMTGFIEGYKALSAEFGVPLLGGDTTSSLRDVAVSVTAIGRAPADRIKRRSAAQPYDVIFVTGPLGDSAEGLADVLAGHADTPAAHTHHNPRPLVREGAWLGAQCAVHAMMDLSDGLASDLQHILRASGLRAFIDTDAIPTRTSIERAATGGEDYQLLLTAAPDRAGTLADAFARQFGTPLYPIGETAPGPPGIAWLRSGIPFTPDWHGYRHF